MPCQSVLFETVPQDVELAGHTRLPWRQRDVLVLQSLGLFDSDIADSLSIKLETVRNHTYAVRKRISAQLALPLTRDQAVAWSWLHRPCCVGTSYLPTLVIPELQELEQQHFDADSALTPVLCLLASGTALGDVAERLRVEESGLRARMVAIRDKIWPFETSRRHLRPRLAAWVFLHRQCCLAGSEPCHLRGLRS